VTAAAGLVVVAGAVTGCSSSGSGTPEPATSAAPTTTEAAETTAVEADVAPPSLTVAPGKQQRSALYGYGAHRYRTTVGVDASYADVALLARAEGVGQAGPGRAWLLVSNLRLFVEAEKGTRDDETDRSYRFLIYALDSDSLEGGRPVVTFTLGKGTRPKRAVTSVVNGTELLFDVPATFSGGSLVATPAEVLGSKQAHAVHADTTVLEPMSFRVAFTVPTSSRSSALPGRP
jgi:hypothetical protein